MAEMFIGRPLFYICSSPRERLACFQLSIGPWTTDFITLVEKKHEGVFCKTGRGLVVFPRPDNIELTEEEREAVRRINATPPLSVSTHIVTSKIYQLMIL
jgi:hypothetical protein